MTLFTTGGLAAWLDSHTTLALATTAGVVLTALLLSALVVGDSRRAARLEHRRGGTALLLPVLAVLLSAFAVRISELAL